MPLPHVQLKGKVNKIYYLCRLDSCSVSKQKPCFLLNGLTIKFAYVLPMVFNTSLKALLRAMSPPTYFTMCTHLHVLSANL